MPGATIDHLVAIVIFLVATLLFVNLFSQNLQSAILYQRNSQLVTEASDILDSISLSPGSLAGNSQYWATSKSIQNLSLFGLQDPTQEGYVIGPFSLMRLNASNAGTPYHAPFNGLWYSNVTMAPSGGYLFVPFSSVVNYTRAAQLLGVGGSYGFQLAIIPTMNISMSQTNANPLQIRVTVTGSTVTGSGLPLAGVSLNYYLINSTSGSKYPKFRIWPSASAAYTSAAGSVVLNFSSVNAGKCAYALVVYANLEGLSGAGYLASPAMTNKIIPVVGSFSDGKGNATILLASSPSMATLYFNATFLVLGSSVSSVVQLSIHNATASLPDVTGLLNSTNHYVQVQIPNNNQTGILVITYNSTAGPGFSLLPWGVGSLGNTIVYGSAVPSSSNKDWVTTDVRQVIVAGESYQLKITLWSLAGYQAQSSSGGAGI